MQGKAILSVLYLTIYDIYRTENRGSINYFVHERVGSCCCHV